MVNISVIDYMGKINDGVGIILSLKYESIIYEMMYWINRKNEYKLLADEKLLNFLQIKNIYEYKHLDDLIISIHQILPPIEDIFKQFDV